MTKWTAIELWQTPPTGRIISFGRWQKGDEGEESWWHTETMRVYADSDFEIYRKLFERYFVLPEPPKPGVPRA